MKEPQIIHRGMIISAVSERQQAENYFRLEETLVNKITEASPHVIYVYDLPQQKIVFTNPQLARCLGYTRNEIAQFGDNVLVQLLHPDDLNNMQKMLERWCLATDHEIIQSRYRLQHKNGDWLWFLDRNTVFRRCENGSVEQVLGMAQDITEFKRMEDELQQAHKMESIGRLAGGIAHDFNNILTAITGNCNILLRTLPDGETAHEIVCDILNASKRATGLTRQLQVFNRKQLLQSQECDLNEIITRMEKMLRNLAGENTDLSLHLEPELGPIEADPSQIEQIILNLVVNARDAMPDGGQLVVATENVTIRKEDGGSPRKLPFGDYRCLTVRDTGVGMDDVTKARMFEPFYTTKAVGKGTGLGLATVYGIVQQSGGQIAVDSEINQGTTFRVFLPAASVMGKAGQGNSDKPPSILAKGRETVLLVEDADVVRSMAKRILQMCGYEVLEAKNGEEGLRVSDEFTDPIHLVITDVVMPRLNGREMVKELLQKRPEIQVIYISGDVGANITERDFSEIKNQILQKPFDMNTLAEKVRLALNSSARH